jgi:hypothetical protein
MLLLFLKWLINFPVTQWLTPVILATPEADIRRIAVRSQLGQIVSKKPITKKGLIQGLMAQPIILATWKAKIGRILLVPG